MILQSLCEYYDRKAENPDSALAPFGFEEKDIREIVEKIKAFGVKKVGPCHCSGDEARKIFYEKYKDDFIEIGVGKEVVI